MFRVPSCANEAVPMQLAHWQILESLKPQSCRGSCGSSEVLQSCERSLRLHLHPRFVLYSDVHDVSLNTTEVPARNKSAPGAELKND